MTDQTHTYLATAIFAFVGILVGVDLVADAGSGTDGAHLAVEAMATLLALSGAVVFGRRGLAARREAAEWRAKAEELLAGAGNTIERQFGTWELTPAEAEVAVLLLKGLAFKEIAAVRGTGERTAREQARKVYAKAGVAGRAELSAWFMEDLL